MADVQLEHGHTRIADALFEALIRSPMPGRHKDVVFAVIRLTYGYPKLCGPQNERRMGAALIQSLIPIQDRRIRRILIDLEKWGLIERTKGVNGSTPSIRLVKDFETWRLPAGADPDITGPGPQEDRVTGEPGSSGTGDPGPRRTGDPGQGGPASRDKRDNLETLPSGGPRVPRSPPRGLRDPPKELDPDQRQELQAWRDRRDADDPASKLTDRDLLNAEEICLDWHRGKGRRAKDWVATVRTWIRRDLKTGPPARASPRPTKLEYIAENLRKSEERGRERERQKREAKGAGNALRVVPERAGGV